MFWCCHHYGLCKNFIMWDIFVTSFWNKSQSSEHGSQSILIAMRFKYLYCKYCSNCVTNLLGPGSIYTHQHRQSLACFSEAYCLWLFRLVTQECFSSVSKDEHRRDRESETQKKSLHNDALVLNFEFNFYSSEKSRNASMYHRWVSVKPGWDSQV